MDSCNPLHPESDCHYLRPGRNSLYISHLPCKWGEKIPESFHKDSIHSRDVDPTTCHFKTCISFTALQLSFHQLTKGSKNAGGRRGKSLPVSLTVLIVDRSSFEWGKAFIPFILVE
ncbi:hypothetical protein CDAR_592671 [Caerostris darwini]|uniref:Uncharacterized protein n=1 Tax=Caerostris darwini TaxID=1538125 RepID=A0AAV4RZN6_9ARAC|nr:hypothetical protein CDAR_592671 [Caerostris darwini]